PSGLVQDGDDHRVPGPFSGVPFDPRLQRVPAARMDSVPVVAKLGDRDRVGGDRFRAVVNEGDEPDGEDPQTNEAKHESDHGGACSVPAGGAGIPGRWEGQPTAGPRAGALMIPSGWRSRPTLRPRRPTTDYSPGALRSIVPTDRLPPCGR